jgi:NADH pyrophosphatase NudC (nudix superfamily)
VFIGVADGEIVPNPEEVAEYGWFSYQEAMRLDFAYDYDKVIGSLYDLELISD